MTFPIHLYNTKTRVVERFYPLHKDSVGIYSCGPTVYHYAHIGNLRAYVFADTLRRMFVQAGYSVNHVINITDVGHTTDDGDTGEDKMEKGSRREGKSAFTIARFYEDAFRNDLRALVIPETSYSFPRATETIPEQLALIQQLSDKGYTYQTSDGIYFDTSKFSNYPDLAMLDVEGLRNGARVEENKEKRNSTDFALWKFSPKNVVRQMEWDSPWGVGFPGWHIECSAMSKKYLGNHFDIHTGGIDHIPVHHTNEIAQSECANNEQYVNYWMHVNFLNDTTGKMSKSNDGFLTLDSLIKKGYDPLAYRYLLLTTHYRKEVTFSYEALDSAANAYKKLTNWCKEHATTEGVVNDTYLQKCLDALHDDLGTPTVIAHLWTLIKDTTVPTRDAYATLMVCDELLGLNLSLVAQETVLVSDEVRVLFEARASARLTGNYIESDRLRDEIIKLGFTVKDTSKGQELSKL
jgi:cysteinyl-tRNA synthetase